MSGTIITLSFRAERSGVEESLIAPAPENKMRFLDFARNDRGLRCKRRSRERVMSRVVNWQSNNGKNALQIVVAVVLDFDAAALFFMMQYDMRAEILLEPIL
jgi:hypothetical protein